MCPLHPKQCDYILFAVTSWTSGAPNDGFLSKYIENTFQVIQSTFRYLEMHSKQRAIKFVSVQ